MNKTVAIVFFSVLFLFTTAPLTTVSELLVPTITQTNTSFNTSNTLTSPINITSNSQLANQASSGNGSSTNPYIIENYNINSCTSNKFGVSIQNTNKYFILRNITVSNCFNGFLFLNVTFGSIINSYAINNNEASFSVISSSNNILINNTAIHNLSGFTLTFSSNNNTLINNTSTNNWYAGFYVGSSFTTLINNTATYNFVGFYLPSSTNSTLINNTATYNFVGFSLASCSNTMLINNTGQYNREDNYIAGNSTNTILINNIFTNPPSPPHFDLIEIFGALILLVMIIAIVIGAFIYIRTRKRFTTESQHPDTIAKPDIEHKSDSDMIK